MQIPAYFDLYKMKLVAGKNLQQSDTTKEFVINETYAKLLGFSKPADAIGHFIERDHQCSRHRSYIRFSYQINTRGH